MLKNIKPAFNKIKLDFNLFNTTFNFMKNILKLSFLLAMVATAWHAAAQSAGDKPFVIPEIKEWRAAEGRFVPDERTRIVYPAGSAELERVARMLSADCGEMFGIAPEVKAGRGRKGDVTLTLGDDRTLGDEGYAIAIGDKIELSAPTAKGVYWGTRTLLQIAEQSDDRSLPRGEIRDFPDYAVRGFMIDCGRKFIPMRFLRDYVKIMAYYKMNTLQIHLNDNAFKQYFGNDWYRTYSAFRMESETFPELTARDGYYTKREFIDLQISAEDRFVEIIPEIDAPAHTLAFSRYNPELGSKEYGPDHLDLFNPATYEFMDALWREYLEGDEPVFRGKRVHIGTDEYSNKDREVVEKFRAFTDRYIRYVESFGKQACVWGALTHAKGETPVKSDNVVMSAWYNGYADPVEMVKQGYKLISIPDGLLYIVPAAGYYYDYLNTRRLYESWTPAQVGGVKFDERDPAILGGMFAVWNDHAGNGISAKDIHHRAYPAIQTLAVKMWSGAATTLPFDEFDARRKSLSEAPGVNQMGRIGRATGLVYSCDEVEAGSRMPHREIGYGYRVTFRMEVADEARGTELFRSPDAVFYLSDPISGMMGFARDGYLNTFDYGIRAGETVEIAVEGDNISTRLYVNGRLADELKRHKICFNEGKDSMSYVPTLVFPLERAGDFKSRITDLKVYNTTE